MHLLEITDKKSAAIFQYIQELSDTINNYFESVKILDWRNALFKKANIYHYHYSNSTFKVILPLLFTPSGNNIVTIHDILPRSNVWKAFISPFFYLFINFKSKYIIVHTEHAKELLLSNFPFFDRKKVYIIPFGDNPSIPTPKNYLESRSKLKISKNHIVFLYLGVLKKNKGISNTVKAFSKLKIPNVKLLLIGKIVDEVTKNLIKNNKDKRIIYLGFVPNTELHNWLIASDALVNFRTDTVGETSASVIKMLSHGKPILGTKIGSNIEVIKSAGMLCGNDIDQIKNLLSLFATEESKRNYLTSQAKKRSIELQWKNYKLAYKTLFNQIKLLSGNIYAHN